jgi:hypothetical protein
MELWNEYEGRTIDGAFPLTKLLSPEGRSAFFSTTNGTGVPTVIRLIESHFDDEEILARWRGIAKIEDAHLVTLKKFGKVELDGSSLVYAVMEPVEANLGEVLEERRLTVAETKQVATSVVSALQVLHAHGYVHEHVAPGNVFAVGEAIKLRSDCIREVPEGEEGRELMRRDAQDFARLLLRALTQQRTLEAAARDLPLIAPFDEIVTKGMSGEWGLAEMSAALVSVDRASASSVPIANAPAATRTAVREVPVERATAAVKRTVLEPTAPLPSSRVRVAVVEERRGGDLRKILYGVGVFVVGLLVWLFVHGRSTGAKSVTQEVAAPAIAAPAIAAPVAVAGPGETASVPAAESAVVPQRGKAGGNTRSAWRVVAYTYNHEGQAQKKAETIAQKHSELRPEVFTPNGRAPYLVTVGGEMSKDDAFALAKRARGEGLPHDIYAQNYIGR